MSMLTQTFGIELEMSGISRKAGAAIIAKYFGTEVNYLGTYYDTYGAKDKNGRTWKCMYDSSIIASMDELKCEMVTPILTYDADIVDLQNIIREFRKAGAISSPLKQCGIHVHIGADRHSIKSLKNLVNFMSANQDIIYKALKIDPHREYYCKKLESVLVDNFNVRGLDTIEKCESAWYGKGNENGKYSHYNSTRYHGLNLHAVFSKGTVEFRLFNGTLHAGEVRSYILLCLAISQFALDKKTVHRAKHSNYNDKYTMGLMLGSIGLAGEEYKVVREHLMKNLSGKLSTSDRKN